MTLWKSPLTEKQLAALRISIAAGIKEAVYEYLNDPHNMQDVWCNEKNGEWQGPDVVRECNVAYTSIVAWAKAYPDPSVQDDPVRDSSLTEEG